MDKPEAPEIPEPLDPQPLKKTTLNRKLVVAILAILVVVLVGLIIFFIGSYRGRLPLATHFAAGTYYRSDGKSSIVITNVTDKQLTISGNAQWIGEGTGNVNEGTIDGIASINGSTAIYLNYGCEVKLAMVADVLSVEDNNACGGVNVTFSGEYKAGVSPTPNVSTGSVQKLTVTSWKKARDHFSEISYDYPSTWFTTTCPGEGVAFGCETYSPQPTNNELDSLIQVSGDFYDQSATTDKLVEANISIPSLSSGEKTNLYQTSSGDLYIHFTHNSVQYFLTLSQNILQYNNFDQTDALTILKHMAQSVTFLHEPYSCSDPAITSLATFPADFTLWNSHQSDGLDAINSVNPYARLAPKEELNGRLDTNISQRIFMINYAKSGGVFTDQNFINTVAPMSTKADASTSIDHVNCIISQDDGPGAPEIYRIEPDDTDTRAVHVYGFKDNSTQLWGTANWNINLLKKTRNEVYVRMGSQWQKYAAKDYFVSEVNAYGGKPAIYLYPQTTSKVNVTIHPIGKLIKTDELYNPLSSGWSIIATPQGVINSYLPYLYYEAQFPFARPERGYVVAYSQLFSFTHNYIQNLGLNKTEAEAFINYWKSVLQPAPYYFVSHLDLETINKIYPLEVSPSPDSLLRVEIYFEPLSHLVAVEGPQLPKVEPRIGFTAVEWGAIYNK